MSIGGLPPVRQRHTTLNDVQLYNKAIDQGGNVNQNTIKAASNPKEAIVDSYAGEFYLGGRNKNDSAGLDKAVNSIYDDLNSGDPNAQNAGTFAQVASKYKNAGGNYDNGKLKDMLKSKGVDVSGGGIGKNDVETLAAVTKALKEGKITLDDVMQSGAVKDKGLYDKAIASVKEGDLGKDIGGGGGGGKKDAGKKGGGNAGNAGNAGNSKGGGMQDKSKTAAGDSNAAKSNPFAPAGGGGGGNKNEAPKSSGGGGGY